MQSIRGLSTALVVLAALSIPLGLLNVISVVRLANRARDLIDGNISVDSFRDDAGVGATGLGQFLLLAIAPVTMVWMYRMATNVRSLGRQGLRFAPGWAIGGWFAPPCILYVVPWLMFRELWKASDPEAGSTEWRQSKVSPIVDIWWVLYGLVPIVSLVSTFGAVGILRTDDSDSATRKLADQLDARLTLNVVIAAAGVLAAVAYLVLVRQLSARHRRATGEA
jgi:Domain of unknown function (DUF4328)